MRRSFVKIAWILLYAFALAGSSGFATCGFQGPDEEAEEEAEQNPEGAAEDEMMEDVIRDSER
jgi:hypothetical protein